MGREPCKIYKKTEMKKKISIIIATYNAAKTLRRCLDSIIPQLTDETELILVDGGSEDETNEIIDSYGDKVAVHISEPDKGIYDAWNKGVKVAKGKWIGFVGADDIMNPGAIPLFLNEIQKTPEIDSYDYICAYNQFVDDDGNVLRRIGGNPSWDKMRKGNCIAHVCSLHNKKNLFDQVGMYEIRYEISADYEILVRKKNMLKAHFFEAYIMRVQVGGMSFSTKALKEVYEIRKQHHTVPTYVNVYLYLRDLLAFKMFILRKRIRSKMV